MGVVDVLRWLVTFQSKNIRICATVTWCFSSIHLFRISSDISASIFLAYRKGMIFMNNWTFFSPKEYLLHDQKEDQFIKVDDPVVNNKRSDWSWNIFLINTLSITKPNFYQNSISRNSFFSLFIDPSLLRIFVGIVFFPLIRQSIGIRIILKNKEEEKRFFSHFDACVSRSQSATSVSIKSNVHYDEKTFSSLHHTRYIDLKIMIIFFMLFL